MNSFVLIGPVEEPIQLTTSKAGKRYARFALRVPRKEEFQGEDSDVFDLVAFGQTAERMAEEVQEGSMVAVTGKVQSDVYTTNSGDSRRSIKLIAWEIQLVGEAPAPKAQIGSRLPAAGEGDNFFGD